jgi:Ca2+-binding RTX toxin-like protein
VTEYKFFWVSIRHMQKMVTIQGGPDGDQLFVQNGEDNIVGGLDDDLVVGGPGDDHLFGGPGDDQLKGNS